MKVDSLFLKSSSAPSAFIPCLMSYCLVCDKLFTCCEAAHVIKRIMASEEE